MMELETEVRNLVLELEDTLKKAETEIKTLTKEIENEEVQRRVKLAMAQTVRRTITELEKIEQRLKQ